MLDSGGADDAIEGYRAWDCAGVRQLGLIGRDEAGDAFKRDGF